MAFVNHEPVTLALFHQSIAAAIRHFALVREKHTEMRAYLVISSHGRQVDIAQPLKQMIQEHPGLLVDGKAKSEFLTFLRQTGTRKRTPKWEKHIQKFYFEELSAALEFDPSQQFELRFHHLDYPLIEKLQSDPLTNQTLTPKSKASIRIVLGTVGGFAKKER